MKKITLTITILIAAKIFGQSDIMRVLDSDPRISTSLRNNNVYDPTKKSNSIEGNPYTDINFKIAKIPSINAPINFRYNAYKDLIEFKDGENLYELPKDQAYSPIVLQNNTKIILEKNNDGSLNYYTELYNHNNISLLKKDKTTITEAKSTDGYRDATPAKFSAIKTDYLLKINGKIENFPKNRKALNELIGNNEYADSYAKKNSSYIKDESQLIELTKIIAKN